MKILIVEDQAISREMLVKILQELGEVESFDSGEDALKAFEAAFKNSEPFDLMILDISMPGMSGLELLKSIRGFEVDNKIIKDNHAKAIMFTSYADKETVVACYKAGCDDYAVKPFNKKVLINKIQKLGLLLDNEASAESVKNNESSEKTMGQLVSDAIEEFKKGKIDLPSLPNIVQELKDLINSPNASVSDMAKIIENDTAISIKLIIAANSPFYKGIEKTKDVKMAINRLGLDVTQSIVSAIANKVLYETKNPSIKILMEKIWKHSFATANCAREITKKVASVGYEDAYVKGLIHDVGAALLIKNIAESLEASANINIEELNAAVFEVHASFGAALLKKWNFSDDFINVANFHEWNQFNKNTEREILVVNLADILSYKIGYGFFSKELDFSQIQSAQLLGLNDDDLAVICEKSVKIISESAGTFSKV